MFIHGLYGIELSEEALKMISMIETQINLAINLVNDFQDVNLINCSRLKPKIELFNPKAVFAFVRNMFVAVCNMEGIQLIFKNLDPAFM